MAALKGGKVSLGPVEAYIFHLNTMQKYLNKKVITDNDKKEIAMELKKNRELVRFVNTEVKED